MEKREKTKFTLNMDAQMALEGAGGGGGVRGSKNVLGYYGVI